MRTMTAVALALFVGTTAQAIPMTQQGRLTDSTGATINGSRTLRFSLHNALTNGNEVWFDTFTEDLQNGYYAVVLGSNLPLSQAVFSDNAALWVEISVDGTTLEPRTELTYSPWASHATTAGTALGAHIDGNGQFVLGPPSAEPCGPNGAMAFDSGAGQPVVCFAGVWSATGKNTIDLGQNGVRTWSNGSLATSCDEYRNPTLPIFEYAGDTGDGNYRIDPNSGSATDSFVVECDMAGIDGWVVLTTDRTRAYWDLSYSSTNTTDKCGYDGVSTETDGTYTHDQLTQEPQYSCDYTVNLQYRSASADLTDSQIAALRTVVSQYDASSPLFSGDCDSDTTDPSWEAYAVATDSTEFQLSTGASSSNQWNVDTYQSTATLDIKYLLPDQFHLKEHVGFPSCGNGGGIIAGWGASEIRMR